jgi:DNA polymerase III epsilon subunit-like protein
LTLIKKYGIIFIENKNRKGFDTMKFCIDFEATRFSNRIISIGCVAENGNAFYSLVKPGGRKKVDKFITELTGIDNAMLTNAPDADEAFNLLNNFIEENNDNAPPEFYCYGDADIAFIQNTVKFMEDTRACICAMAIAGNLINYAPKVKQFFAAPSDIALRKVYMLIQSQDELVQNHDALEDARMLQCVLENLTVKCKPEDKEAIMAIPSQARPKAAKKKAPATFISWTDVPKWEADTKADANNWVLKCVDQNNTNYVKYFNDTETAALWVIKYIARNVSPKNQGSVNRIKSMIDGAQKSGKCRYNCYWELNEKGE